MYCSKCGAEIADDSEYCSKCGNKISKQSEDIEGSVNETSIVTTTENNNCKIHKTTYIVNKIKSNSIASIITTLLTLVISFLGFNFIVKTIADIYVDYTVMNCQESIVAIEKSAPLLATGLSGDIQKLSDEKIGIGCKIALIILIAIITILSIIITVRMIRLFLIRNHNNEIEKNKFNAIMALTLLIFIVGACITFNNAKSSFKLIGEEASILKESSSSSSVADTTAAASSQVTSSKPELLVDSDGKKLWKVYSTQQYIHFSDTYKGTGNFIIDVLDSNQDFYENVVNEIGDYTLEKTVSAPNDGSGYFYIEQKVSDGEIEDSGEWDCTNIG